MLRTGVLNLSLRGITLASRFVLVFFIARYLTPEELGVFGLMNVTVMISLLMLGLDFYSFSTREILAREDSAITPLVRDQFVFHALVYVVILPALLIIFVSNTLPWKYTAFFYAVLVLEHLAQESFRLLTTLSRPVTANIVLFFRSGIWVYAAVTVAWLRPECRNLPFIWTCWMGGGVLALLWAGYSLRHAGWQLTRKMSVDWSWLKRGVKVSMPFFIATVALMGVQYADRYFLQHFHGEAEVGIYTFFASVANVVQVFVFTGVTMILYPRIVSAFQRGQHGEYRNYMKKLAVGAIGGSVGVAILLAVLITPLLSLVGKEQYAEALSIFWLMLTATILFAASHVPHYALYARQCDRAIVWSTVTALGVSLICNSFLVPLYGLMGAAISTCAAMGTLFLVKTISLLIAASKRNTSTEQESAVVVARGAVS